MKVRRYLHSMTGRGRKLGLALTLITGAAGLGWGLLPDPAAATQRSTLAMPQPDGVSGYPSADASAMQARPAGMERTEAAFVRGGALWVKERGKERQLTPNGGYARNPAWSPDGRWIAYNAGQEQRQIWIVDVGTGKSHLAAPEGGSEFQWSPSLAKDRLAYLQEQELHSVGAEEGDESVDVAGEIGNFSWLPDGSGYLISSAAQLLPDGWTPVRISRIMLATEASDPVQEEQLYVLPKQINDLIVVGTSTFKWSATGAWIAFLATPTASLSADSNTLCVLSLDGKSFLPVTQMARDEQWFQWSRHSSEGDRLAYIDGIGREASSNKRLTVTPVPALQPKAYTPSGFVDQNFAWYGEDSILVSRAAEGAWSGDPGKRPRPSLVKINLSRATQDMVTISPEGWGDFSPVSLSGGAIGWVRSDRTVSNVMLAKSAKHAKKAPVWIQGIDLGDNFYEQWNWLPVLRFKEENKAAK
ncbi:hypothetical protein GZH47_26810 [Paenibacillus rhizovicinus]|uniref:Translocation protein TolB n=1 Tax=Paenibacillus rhizovicinus TaxID=2704463 RepID=A0A6C0P6I6_9BACL|nr:PD40 domain-containing protein [Paenibacillus rhizovicinus]QHW34045.1 hypothetical protein GZH47_26810 [Paenibacillus rhizovicinus]